LGLKPTFKDTPIRDYGCDCYDCKSLNRFRRSADVSREFPLNQSERQHLETKFRSAKDITFSISKHSRPYSLVATKREDIAKAQEEWNAKIAGAGKFLRACGFGSEPEKLLQDLYGAEYQAFRGGVLDPTSVLEPATPSGNDQISNPQALVGTKRKRSDSGRGTSTSSSSECSSDSGPE